VSTGRKGAREDQEEEDPDEGHGDQFPTHRRGGRTKGTLMNMTRESHPAPVWVRPEAGPISAQEQGLDRGDVQPSMAH
jgi:hypothetical protein